jgi:hypothetical protein
MVVSYKYGDEHAGSGAMDLVVTYECLAVTEFLSLWTF